jgi:hypothetical protein
MTERLPLQVAPIVEAVVNSAVAHGEGGIQACGDPYGGRPGPAAAATQRSGPTRSDRRYLVWRTDGAQG